jgi:hypothetical protein
VDKKIGLDYRGGATFPRACTLAHGASHHYVLRCNTRASLPAVICLNKRASIMRKSWNTQYGPRRVRWEPPTLDDAIFAARGMTDDVQQQAEIAAALMDEPVEKVRVAVLKASQKKDVNRVTFTTRRGSERAVVVERKVSRRPAFRTFDTGR